MNFYHRLYTISKHFLMLSLVMVFATGCGGTLKNSWLNFRAYYNTYYNAEQNYRAGLTKVKKQSVEINPQEPVRVHSPTVQAGNNDFKKAIKKGARILRKFPDSKWLDDALLLIGKSYYYRHEFYRALQKFEELLNASESPKMEQIAIIWKGRTQLELKKYSEGISFLKSELANYPADWSIRQKAEINILLAEHYAMVQNWQQAEEILSEAITNLEKKKILGRSYFLHGQLLERLERYGEAFYAYSQVSEHFPNFEYVYWAGVKQGDVARKMGNLSQAISIYTRLRRDDKNYERIDELNFKISRTIEMKGGISVAEQSYKRILSKNSIPRTLKGKIYFRLGKIYSNFYEKFDVAAAYFDSSSAMGSQQQTGKNGLAAQTLAEAYGDYTQLQHKVAHTDSLLWLGSLSPEQLDSVISEKRERKRRALLKKRDNAKAERLINRGISSSKNNNETRSSIHGFLNHKNNELIARGKKEFQIIWGNRPLTDNWRRIQAVGQSRDEVFAGDSKQENQLTATLDTDKRAGLNIDISEIPQTKKAKKKLRKEQATALYEMGNLLFMNLGMPDSASSYFRKVIASGVNADLRPRAMYSLYEIYNTEGQTDSLKYWRSRILKEYPQSRYAYIIRSGNRKADSEYVSDSTTVRLKEQYHQLISSEKKVAPGQLRRLALSHRSSKMAPYIYYQAIKRYARQARTVSDSISSGERAFIDSTRFDTTLPVIDVDSTRDELENTYWDSVRIAVHEFDTTFTNAKQRSKVKQLKSFLENRRAKEENVATCEEFGLSLTIKPNMQAFLSKVNFPDELKGRSLSGEVTYSFLVDQKGNIESYKLMSNRTSLGIEEAFEKAFDENLQFKAFESEEVPLQLRCTKTFPIQQ
ncbi:hypothetical protein [Fodinibius halophilus]|uniref:TonB C-terminal domain-containing protein n=1 Tax=Fodinibius halophilus TaxID=1736908 RepID=A0A6M1T1J4_9BACT|nr:hypothetical protein [Fodinibius halophilus]NGP87867.1 hypothetical protein [Fodinibius halophilus]